MIGFLKEKLERDNDKLMNNNHNLKSEKMNEFCREKVMNEFCREKVMNNFVGKKMNEFCREKVMNNFIPNYIDLINFKLKCYQK